MTVNSLHHHDTTNTTLLSTVQHSLSTFHWKKKNVKISRTTKITRISTYIFSYIDLVSSTSRWSHDRLSRWVKINRCQEILRGLLLPRRGCPARWTRANRDILWPFLGRGRGRPRNLTRGNGTTLRLVDTSCSPMTAARIEVNGRCRFP